MGSLFLRDPAYDYPVLARGDGIYLYDEAGRRYIDGIAGAGNVTLGHGRARIARAMAAQAEDLAYCFSAFFANRPSMDLAERVAAAAPPGLSHACFASGGSEAIETAFKLARQYHLLRGKPGKARIIGRWRSYHGATLGALSATGLPSLRAPFAPWLADFPHIAPCYPYRCDLPGCGGTCNLACARELEAAILAAGADTVAAFVAEPVVMAGMAAQPASPDYFRHVRRICDEHDVLLIADEIITGWGRTGRHFALEHWGVAPDLLAFGKGASSGYAPLGGVVIHDRIAAAFAAQKAPFAHVFTYVNNPVAARVGLEVLDIMAEEAIVARARQVGEYALAQLQGLRRHRCVGQVRGLGLLLGIELVADAQTRSPFAVDAHVAQRACRLCLDRGLALSGVTAADFGGGDDLRLYPPLIIERAHVDEVVQILDDALGALDRELETVR